MFDIIFNGCNEKILKSIILKNKIHKKYQKRKI